MIEQDETPEKELSKMVANNLTHTEFKTLVVRLFNELKRRIDEKLYKETKIF